MKRYCLFLLIGAATSAAQSNKPLPVDGNYVQGVCGSGGQCVTIRACFGTSDFAGEVKLAAFAPYVVVVLPSRGASPTNVMPGATANPCAPTVFRLLGDGETPPAGSLLLRVRTLRKFTQDAIIFLRYASSAHMVFLEPNPEG
jgi:hypothetical protein